MEFYGSSPFKGEVGRGMGSIFCVFASLRETAFEVAKGVK